MSNARFGLAIGMALGFAAAFGGPREIAIVVFGGIVGLFAGRALDGVDDLVAATDSLIQRAQVTSGEWAARLRESRIRTANRVRARTASLAERTRTSSAALAEQTRKGTAAAGVRARAGATASRELIAAGANTTRVRARAGAEAASRWAQQVRTRSAAAATARGQRRQAKRTTAETRVLRLGDLTNQETVELRDRPGLRLPPGQK